MLRSFIILSIFLFIGCANTDIEVLKKSVAELNAQNVDLKKEISDIKSNLREIDRKIKTNSEDTKLNSEALLTLKADIKSLESKTNERLKQLESSKGNKPENIQNKIQSSNAEGSKVYIEDDITDKTTLYNLALELFKSNRYEESLNKFRSFVVRFPEDSLADNALYWMGEIYFQTGDMEKALESFNNVINNYPNENKVPDAIFKSAIVNDKLGKRDLAIDLMKKLILNFKYAEISKVARDKLKEWGVKNE
ncbi:MAG: tol-pal system protein YbgF [Calditerrivibrio sp.]|nr:tol-pal system protein YbgF [Calditerrivibrio sp.]MCA1933169.1 tol-pal system protein YbgF [Calditerrivibrio sp.]MCA1980108.1 tol-pal system protein YbgF [Calditerrivibrio sp.]